MFIFISSPLLLHALNDSLLDKTYPVGSIYMSVSNINPSTLFGGKWVAWGSGRVPVGVNTSDSNFSTVEKTGGASTHTLTTAQIPSHNHGSVPIHTSGSETSGYGLAQSTLFQNRVAIAESIASENWNTGNTGSGKAHNNLQPYITCYMWKRTA